MSRFRTMLTDLWKLCCSLKLAIVLATLATLTAFAGSLLMPARPWIFAQMDGLSLGEWFAAQGWNYPEATWWIGLYGALLLLLGLNTACCIIDWLGHLRARWRKSGEYLIHLGFVLLLAAYLWGSLAGFRVAGETLAVGEIRPVPRLPGHYLRLHAVEPVLGSSGHPMDVRSTLSLLRGETVLVRQAVRANHPLTWKGLTVLGVSFGQRNDGFRFAGRLGTVELRPGSRVALPDGGELHISDYRPNGLRRGNGGQAFDPIFFGEIRRPGHPPEAFRYRLREPLPPALVQTGLDLRPQAPLQRPVSILTIHYDPGLNLAFAGALLMTLGILLALGSFYRKRTRGDRPRL
ncbi:cytochrome c biogenesis protein ResB [Trichloromonas sp.]|uniref:cytochrome c biogenesis protein ResB n=1 Tax=Trichloromonas sp. TaxID=3069249 RepID=UPI002A3B0D68|nr:cytochrome c biogenesis protein ResB [Trichloromonas sp.]